MIASTASSPNFSAHFSGPLGQQLGRPARFRGRRPCGRRWWRRGVRARSCQPHGDAGGGHVGLGLADGEGAEVEDRGGEHRAGVAFGDAFDQVVERADPARWR